MSKGTRPLLLLVRALQEASEAPVLLPDVQLAMERVARRGGDFRGLERTGRTFLFHLLRDLEVGGLVERSDRGYRLSEQGRSEAEVFAGKHEDLAATIHDAAVELVAA